MDNGIFNLFRSGAVCRLPGAFTEAEGICRSLDTHNHKKIMTYGVSLKLNLPKALCQILLTEQSLFVSYFSPSLLFHEPPAWGSDTWTLAPGGKD